MDVQPPHDYHGESLLFRRQTFLDCRWINFAIIMLHEAPSLLLLAASHIVLLFSIHTPLLRQV